MQVREVMSQKPEVLSAQASIREAATSMRTGDNGILPIFQGDKLIGMVTDRDVAVRGVGDGKNLDDPIASIVSGPVLYCFEDDDTQSVLQNMQNNHVQRLIVLDNPDNKNLAGIVSLGDIADKCQDDDSSRAIAECCRHYH